MRLNLKKKNLLKSVLVDPVISARDPYEKCGPFLFIAIQTQPKCEFG